MKISYNWLKDYLDFDLKPAELGNELTFAGIEVEGLHYPGKELEQIKIAEIISLHKHPQADNLSICQVNDGNSTVQVICGAPNCRTGQKVALAPIGASLTGFKIKKVKLRGEESLGMLCSEKELGLSGDHEGIMILPEEAPAGTNLATYLQLQDAVYDTEITPNRPDLLGIYGIARDLSALLKIPLKQPELTSETIPEKIENHLSLENQAPDLCTRYTARMIKGVSIGESPHWLKNRLLAVGLRPINNIVDITNYVMMELGHPLHAFDYDKLEGKKIIVRKAAEQEKFPALDEQTYTLSNDDLVIADEKKPVALAGVIGGSNSHITGTTTDIVLEAANFLYSSIRKTAGKHLISTDSSYRFERNISDEMAEIASKRAAQLILKIAGGRLLSGKLDSYPDPFKPPLVKLRLSRITRLLTLHLDEKTVKNHLEALGLKWIKSEPDTLWFEIPPYRKDLLREVDLLEEIIRLHGYNNIASVDHNQDIMDKNRFYTRRKLKSALVDHGFSEVINWSFSDPDYLDKLKIADGDPRRDLVKLKNPLGKSFSILRPTLIPDLLKNALYNINHGQKDLKIFEQAKVFTRNDQKLAREKLRLTGIMTGHSKPVFWQDKSVEVDYFLVKGIIEELLELCRIDCPDFIPSTQAYYLQGQAAEIIFKDLNLGSCGQLDPKIATDFDLDLPVFLFDLDLERILEQVAVVDPVFREIPKFPPVLRDISFLVEHKYSFQAIRNKILAVNPDYIRKVDLFDEYKGDNIKAGFRSLSFKLVFNSSTKTLTDEFINDIIQNVIRKLESEFQIEMR
ncbi:MAG: phenylalanine--tRNA ligase subunit beta [Candidatus Cloacimonetes bacterium]|nr:phenylalanine--tRNA ligase subunit beta [Candidatus Cloacimonadota bacterium]